MHRLLLLEQIVSVNISAPSTTPTNYFLGLSHKKGALARKQMDHPRHRRLR